jgi:tRNA-binding protein
MGAPRITLRAMVSAARPPTGEALAPTPGNPRAGTQPRDDSEMPQITWDDFAKVEIRVGRIVAVDDFPKARKPAYRLRIDFGTLGTKASSAQITQHYTKADLLGKLVLAVVNFPPRQIATFWSEVLTLGVVVGEGDIVLVHPERDVPLGSPIA